ncbi:MAG: hypothetical protein QXJ46_01545 [Candidatus Bathyarchaeia archaeon]
MSENKDKIEEIEREIKEIKSAINRVGEIASTVEDLKRALIDIRSTISELENPFNLLKLITDEEGLAKVNEAKPLIERMAREREEKKEKSPKMVVSELEVGEPPKIEVEKAVETPALAPPVVIDFKRTLALIEWIYTMLDIGFDEDGIRRICEYSEYFGFIPKGSASYISNLASVAKRAKSGSIAEDILALSIYNIANIMGVKIDQDEIADLMRNLLRSRRFNGAWAKGWASQ